MSEENKFERIRDMLAEEIVRQRDAAYKAFGVGQRPYGTHRVTPEEKRAYWESLAPERRLQLWNNWDDKERGEFESELGGNL